MKRFHIMAAAALLAGATYASPFDGQAITAEAKKTGFRKLHEDGLAKVIKGLTSVKELLRVTR